MALQKFATLAIRRSQLTGDVSDPLPPQSDLVLQAKDAVLELLDFPLLVTYFEELQTSLRVSHEAVTKLSSERLLKPVNDLMFSSAVLCDKTVLVLGKYSRACSDILETLQTTYQYLLDGIEDMALDCFSDIADGMVKELFDPTTKLQKQLQDARKDFENKARMTEFTAATSEAERMMKDLADIIARYEKDVEALKSIRGRMRNRKNTRVPSHQNTSAHFLARSSVRAEPRSLKVQEQFTVGTLGDETSKHVEGLTSPKTANLKLTACQKAPSSQLTAGKKKKDTRLAEEKMKLLSRALTNPLAVWTQPTQIQQWAVPVDPPSDAASDSSKLLIRSLLDARKNTIRKSREYVDELDDLQDVAMDSLVHCESGLTTSLDALDGIITIMSQALSFWTRLRDHCKQYGEESLQKSVEESLESMSPEERERRWKADSFKAQAFKFYALWMSLSRVCAESTQKLSVVNDTLLADMKKQTKTDHGYEILKRAVGGFVHSTRREEQELKQKELALKRFDF